MQKWPIKSFRRILETENTFFDLERREKKPLTKGLSRILGVQNSFEDLEKKKQQKKYKKN